MNFLFRQPSIKFRVVAGFLLFGSLSSLFGVIVFCRWPAPQAVLIFAPFLIVASLGFGLRIASFLRRDLESLRAHLAEHRENLAGCPKKPELSSKEIEEVTSEFHKVIAKLQGQFKDFHPARAKTSKQQTAVSETLSNFMYYFAHMIRTPLNAIRWSLESLKNEEVGAVSAPQREILDTMEHAVIGLAGVATELQDTLTVIKGNRLRAKKEACSLLSILDQVAGQWALPARRKNLHLIWDRPAGEFNQTDSDGEQLRRAFGFLLENAVRYSNPDQKIILSIQKIDARPPKALKRAAALPPSIALPGFLISVKDQGIGIPKKEIARVFEPFFRAGNARRHWVDAKGIGLTLAKAIVEQHHGRIWLKSQANRGTTAFVFLPRGR